MHTDQLTAELRQLALRVRDYQRERGWSDATLVREISTLGSTKTYKRVLDPNDPLDELNVENQHTNFTRSIELIEMRRAADKFPEPEYDDFCNVVNSLSAISRAMTEDSIARFVAIQGENGTGKDAVKNALLRRWENITLAVEANEFYRDSLVAPVNAILKEYNRVRKANLEPKHMPMLTFEMLVEVIGNQGLILLMNEAHHLGPRGLNMIKTLINRCPRLVIVAEFIPALLRRLMSGAYEEAIQLFGNRLCERVELSSPPAGEILLLLERRGVLINDPRTLKTVIDDLAKEAPHFGNWRYVIQFSREARALCAGKPLTIEQFVAARTKSRERRMTNQQQKN